MRNEKNSPYYITLTHVFNLFMWSIICVQVMVYINRSIQNNDVLELISLLYQNRIITENQPESRIHQYFNTIKKYHMTQNISTVRVRLLLFISFNAKDSLLSKCVILHTIWQNKKTLLENRSHQQHITSLASQLTTTSTLYLKVIQMKLSSHLHN